LIDASDFIDKAIVSEIKVWSSTSNMLISFGSPWGAVIRDVFMRFNFLVYQAIGDAFQ